MSSYDEFHETEGAGQTRSGRASDVRGNYQQTTGGNVATQDGSNPMGSGGRETDFGSAGGQAQGTPRKTYTARAKFSEYLDDVAQRDRYLKTATRSTNIMGRPTLTFKRREDQLNFQSASADVRMFEDNNLECDRGNEGACQRAGRGDSATEYASPFVSSEHFSDVAYFGGGGRQQVDENAKTVLAPPVPVPLAPPEPVPGPTPAVDEPDEIEPPAPLPPAPEETPNIQTAVDAGGSEHAPTHDQDNRDPISGGGTQSGKKSSASTGAADGLEPLPVPNTTGINSYPRMPRGGYDVVDYRSVFNYRPCQE